jgi:hypothetical protein
MANALCCFWLGPPSQWNSIQPKRRDFILGNPLGHLHVSEHWRKAASNEAARHSDRGGITGYRCELELSGARDCSRNPTAENGDRLARWIAWPSSQRRALGPGDRCCFSRPHHDRRVSVRHACTTVRDLRCSRCRRGRYVPFGLVLLGKEIASLQFVRGRSIRFHCG